MPDLQASVSPLRVFRLGISTAFTILQVSISVTDISKWL